MFKNLIKIAVRNIFKDRFYSALNIVGLSIGITCSLLLTFYVIDELSYDRYHSNSEDIYRIVSDIREPDNAFVWAVAQIPLGQELMGNYSEVKNVVRFFNLGRFKLKHEAIEFQEEELYMADSMVFEMFTYPFLKGDPATALEMPNSIVLSEALAIKYFGSIDCIDKVLSNEEGEFKVTGVIENVPLNSHFTFDGLISRNTFPERQGSWGNFGVFTYVQLHKGTDPSVLEPHFEAILKENVNPIFERMGIEIQYITQRITDIHLYSSIQDEAEEGGDISYVYIFSAIAAFMLVIACINYMNLATARSSKRAKEVGVRKVMGSQKRSLVLQFLTESYVLTLIAVLLSILLLVGILPLFNEVSNKQFGIDILWRPDIAFILAGVLLVVGAFGGSYPAFYLSSFNPITVLKGKSSKMGNAIIRKGLVIIQFSISIFMIISTMVVFNQLQFLKNKDLGFNKEQVIRVPFSRATIDKQEVFKNTIAQQSGVEGVASSNSSPGNDVNKVIMNVEDDKGEMLERGVDFFRADFDFVNVLEMHILEGRNFSEDIPSDTLNAVVVNEAMAKRMNWGTEALGKKFTYNTRDGAVTANVIGVIKDYHQNSLYDEIEPISIFYSDLNRFVFIKINGNNISETLTTLEENWKKMVADEGFEYVFLDQDFNSQYQADQRRGKIFTVFSTLTIVIACLGLLGLTSFTTEQRSKEIGVRKVIGASVVQLMVLISTEFVLLVTIGAVIAMPLAYVFLDSWLEAFAYKIELSGAWHLFALASIMGVVITILTVGYHTYKAAVSNPVYVLKDE